MYDRFRIKLKIQIDRGTRHHHENDIHRAFRELSDLTTLRNTEPIEDDPDWWNVRAAILAYDADKCRPATMWQRRN